jgi:hypothetical protein
VNLVLHYIEYFIANLLIKYDNSVANDQDPCMNLVIDYLDTVYIDRREISKVYWAIVASIVKAALNIEENTKLAAHILDEYQ